MFKRAISAALCIIMLCTTLLCVAPASFASQNGIDTPLVYVQGQGETIYKNYGTPEQKQIYPIQFPESFI